MYRKTRRCIENFCSYACRPIGTKLKFLHLPVFEKNIALTDIYNNDAATIQIGSTGHVYCTLPTSIYTLHNLRKHRILNHLICIICPNL